MAAYSFTSTWRFHAPVERIFEALRRTEDWPQWWPSVEAVTKLAEGDTAGIGARYRYVFRTSLPYKLAFEMTTTHVVAPTEIDGTASGELQGTGRWRLSTVTGGTLVYYFWDVGTTRAWMNLLAPIARPAFAWNHDRVMESGRRGLLRLLSAEQARALHD
jgi:hypothetical protein